MIGYGIDYDGSKIHEATSKPGMEQPLKYWVPSIAPSGMAFYTGDLFPAWKGNLFIGALKAQMLVRLEIDGEKVARRSGCCKVSMNASATCAKIPTARSGSSPTTRTAASCASRRRSNAPVTARQETTPRGCRRFARNTRRDDPRSRRRS